MYRTIFWVVLFLNGLSIEQTQGTSSAIPDLLLHCYENNLEFKQPLTVQSLSEIIRKLEADNENMRMLATSMLHSVILDGIRESQSIRPVRNFSIIPFRASGEEFYKYKFLVDYLTSGESLLFPAESLTPLEICFLHMILSNTVDPWRRGDESTTCKHQSNLPSEIDGMEETNSMSSCPIKKGVVDTKWGTISAGHLIKAIASVLQKSTVTFAQVEEAINRTANKTVTDTTSNDVNNVWVATIAGDLATVVLLQATDSPDIGTEGFWNDTLLPRLYYLKSTNWTMTEADILGGIDGLILAQYLEKNGITGMRISQLIEMFYSDRGILNNDEYKVTKRSILLNKLLNETNLEEQVVNAAKLLQQIGNYDVFLNHQQITELSRIVVDKFKMVAGNITKIYDNVESIHQLQPKSTMEIIIILGGSSGSYQQLQIIHGLFRAMQVSQYGGTLGIINGQSGNWMANLTGELFQLFNDLEQSTKEWPATLSLGTSLETVIYHYQNNLNCSENLKPVARSIIILSRDLGITDNDLKLSLRAFDSIKKSNPETGFIFVTSYKNKTSFTELVGNFWDNDHILTPPEGVHSTVQEISETVAALPGNFINIFCQQHQVSLTDYITPDVEYNYQIRKEYIATSNILTKFYNRNRGSGSICAYGDTRKNNKICKDITVNDEISFDSEELCAPDVTCNVEFQISINATQVQCTENTCKYPDQMRLDIIWQRSSGYVPVQFSIHHIIILAISIFSFK